MGEEAKDGGRCPERYFLYRGMRKVRGWIFGSYLDIGARGIIVSVPEPGSGTV